MWLLPKTEPAFNSRDRLVNNREISQSLTVLVQPGLTDFECTGSG
jgi:hypothetical protein